MPLADVAPDSVTILDADELDLRGTKAAIDEDRLAQRNARGSIIYDGLLVDHSLSREASD
ncbi:hypothetical protein C5613_32685 [Rhodococcus opacus]|uniref:Uncharacterized protein n=1 Tax=Rhodococcus opacus TaxID=37919 RepID=A0A2S8IUE3_RHOOP|nr:hypothetical protein C5613_32685 [Rhodococcus opacus]